MEKAKILVVDDRPEGILSVQAVLSNSEYELVTAASGSEALKHLLKHDFAVILLDVQMPIMNGFETATMIKTRESTRDIPIIFMSAINQDEQYVYQGYQAGAVDYLLKPFDPYILRSKVAIFVDIYRKNRLIKEQQSFLIEKEVDRRELQSLRRYRNLANALPQLILRLNPDATYNLFNDSWFDFTGQTVDDASGLGWKSAIHAEDLGALLSGLSIKDRNVPVEVRVRNRDGDFRWHLFRFQPEFDETGYDLEDWLCSAMDIEEMKQLHAETRQAVELRDEFLSIASHELNTPLTSMKLHLQMTKRALSKKDVDPTNFKKSIEASVKQVDRMVDLITVLLDVSRIQSGKLSFDYETFDLISVIDEIRDRYQEALANSECDLVIQGPTELEVTCDKTRIEQVIINLITNAIKYAPGRIDLQVEGNKGHFRLSVRDHGQGIPEEKLNVIFNRFERVASKNGVGGLGLGLFIVKQIVEGHQGHINVSSEPGEGTTFTVDLPNPHAADAHLSH